MVASRLQVGCKDGIELIVDGRDSSQMKRFTLAEVR